MTDNEIVAEDGFFFFEFRKGRFYPCTKSRWESEWLNWWNKISSKSSS